MTHISTKLAPSAIIIGLLFAAPAWPEQAPSPEAKPDPYAIVLAATEAVRTIGNVAFDFHYRGVGAKAADSAEMQARVEVYRPPGSVHNFIRAEGWRTWPGYDQGGRLPLLALLDDTNAFVRALFQPVVNHRPLHRGGITLLAPAVGRAIMFFTGFGILDGLGVEGVTYTGVQSINGVDCHVVQAEQKKEDYLLRVAFGADDLLIRRYELIYDRNDPEASSVVADITRVERGAASTDPAHYAYTATEELPLKELEWVTLEIGKPAPAWSIELEDGATVSLAGYRGSVLMMDFWASWCAPCRRTMPEVQRLVDEYGDRGLKALGLRWNDSGDATAFLEQLGIRYPTYDADPVAVLYNVDKTGVPALFIIGPDGTLVDYAVGSLNEAGDRVVRRIVAEQVERLEQQRASAP